MGTGAVPAHKQDARPKSSPLGKHGAGGHTVHLPAQAIHEEQAEQDVGHILEKGRVHGRACVLRADEPPVEAVLSQHSGNAPYAYAEVYGQLDPRVGIWLHDQRGKLE